MSTTKSNETKAATQATITDPNVAPILDGNSPLPTAIGGTDYPTPGSTDPVTTGVTTETPTAE